MANTQAAPAEAFHPLVSIVIPVYNGSNYLREAIDSALAQTYDNIEILVINDGSDDNGATEAIAKSYGNKIRYFAKENGGVATALNMGIEHMRGEYFSWLSHDDVYISKKIETQIKILGCHDDKTKIVYGNLIYINECSEFLRNADYHKKYNINLLKNNLYPLINGLIHGCTLLIHKSYFHHIGLFDEKLFTVQDYMLWFEFLKDYKSDLIYIDEPLIKSREHREQGSRKYIKIAEKEQKKLWNEIVHRITVYNINKIFKLLSIEPIDFSENVEIRFCPKYILKNINRIYKKNKFCAPDINNIFNELPQYSKKENGIIYKKIKAYFNLKKFYTIQGKTVIIFEPNSYHGETLIGFAKYFIDFNYNVLFVISKSLKKSNVFCRMQYDNRIHVIYVDINLYFIEKFVKIIRDSSLLFIQSSIYYDDGVGYPMCQYFYKIKNKIFIEHDISNIDKYCEYELYKDNRLFTILPKKYKNTITKSINPHFFGNIKLPNLSDGIIKFISIGVMDNRYRSHDMVYGAVDKLLKENINNFCIDIVGRGQNSYQLKNTKNIKFYGEVDFEKMYEMLSQSMFILMLLDSKNKEHEKYINYITTGSFQLILGFKIIPIIDKNFLQSLYLDETSAIVYEPGDLYSGIVKALNLSKDEYAIKQKNISQLEKKIYNNSFMEIKNAIC